MTNQIRQFCRNIRTMCPMGTGLVFCLYAVFVLFSARLEGQFYYAESFSGTTAPGWEFSIDNPAYPPGARLTAGMTPVAADPENGLTIDADGSGWLRLATVTGNQSNAIALDTPIPSSGNNIKISFDYTMWGGGGPNGADGIAVFLWDADVNFDPGAYGGSLGYAQRSGVNGLSGAYVGVGLDVFGNFGNDQEGRRGAYPSNLNIDNSLNKNQIVVRGPDDSVAQNGTGNYYYLAGTGGNNYTVSGTPAIADLTAGQNMAFNVSVRPDQDAADYRFFEMELTESNLLHVRARFGYTGSLTTLYTVDLSDTYFTNLRPDQLRIGFAAATGGSLNVHEVRNLEIFASGSALGKSNYWDDQNGDNFWQTGQNWNNNTVPQTYDFVAFTDQYPDTLTAQTVILNGGINPTHKNVAFSGATSYTLNAAGSEFLIFDSNTTFNKSYLNIVNSPSGNSDHTINVAIRADDQLFVQNLVQQTLTLNGNLNNNGNAVTFSSVGTTAVNGAISGSGAITVKEDGTTIFSGANTYTGTTTVQNGTLRLRHDSALGNSSAGTTVQSGGTLQFDNDITVTGEAVTIAGVGEGGIGAINNLAGTNSFDTGNISMSGNSTISSTAGSLTIGSTGTFATGGFDLTVQTAAGSAITINRVIADGSGTSDLLKTGAGTLTLGANNTYDGTTTVSQGILRVTNGDALGSTNQDTFVNSGATLELAGGITVAGAETISITGNGVTAKAALWSEGGTNELDAAVIITGGSATFGAASGAVLRVDGGVDGAGQDAIIQADPNGIVEWSSPMDYTGDTFINSGTLRYADMGDRIQDVSNVSVASGANWNLAGLSDVVGSLAGAGNVQLGAATLTAGGNDVDTTYSGTMSGTGNFTKAGTGTMTFNGTNTFTGTLTVNEGTLQVNSANDFTSSMTLALDGGTFATNGESDTLGVFELQSTSTIEYRTGSDELLTFGSVASVPTGTLNMSNWVGTPFTTTGTPASANTAFFVTSGASTTTAMDDLASQTVFLGWGTGAGWKQVAGGYELVPTLGGAYRWDRDNGNWRQAEPDNWLNNDGPNNNEVGAVLYFGDDSEGALNTPDAKTISLIGANSRTFGTMILNGTDDRAYSFQSVGENRTLFFDQTGSATAYLTVGGTESHVIGSSLVDQLNISLSDDLLVQNNSSATTGLTLGSAGGSDALALNDNNLTVTGSSETIIHYQITGTGSLVKSGTGTLELNDNANSYSGGTTLNQGTLQLGADGVLGSGALAINGGTLQALNGTRTITGIDSYSIDGDFTVSGSHNLTFDENGTVTGSRTITVDTVNLTLGGSAGDLTGAGSLTKAGSGTLTLAGDNTDFSGGLTVLAGTVTTGAAFDGAITIGADVGGENYLGTGSITINSGGTLSTVQNVAGGTNGFDFTARGNLTNNGGTATFTNARPTEFDADLYLNGADFNQNSGTTSFLDWNDLELTGASTIDVSGGTLAMNLTGSFNAANPDTNALNINVTGGNFNVTMSNADNSVFTLGTDDALTLAGSSATMTIDAGSATSPVTFNGDLNLFQSSTLNVTQGTTYLTGNTIFNGGSADTAGTLNIQGDLSIDEPLVSHRPNLTLHIADGVAANDSQITAPNGNSSITNLGTVSKSGAGTTLINSSVNNIEASQIVITGGTLLLGASDQIANSTNLVLAGGTPGSATFATGGFAEIVNTLAVTETATIDLGSGNSVLEFLGSGSVASGKTLNITNWSGNLNGFGTDRIIFGEMLSNDFLSSVYWGPSFGLGANQIDLGDGRFEIVPVPEPATIAAGALLTLWLIYDFRRKRKNGQLKAEMWKC